MGLVKNSFGRLTIICCAKRGSLIGEGALCCESAPASVLPCPAGPEDELGAVGSLGHRMGVSEVHSGTGGQKGTSAYLGEKPQVVWASTPELNTASTACGATKESSERHVVCIPGINTASQRDSGSSQVAEPGKSELELKTGGMNPANNSGMGTQRSF